MGKKKGHWEKKVEGVGRPKNVRRAI